jgi:aryl-alcohol dehydrogenase-like predicted oxidoreductase
MPNLILGTANFGTLYGITNFGKIHTKDEISEILLAAQHLGINEFDTAPVYGEIESQLGYSLNQELRPKISSKISSDDSKSVHRMIASVESTLKKTKVSKLENLYLHNPNVLDEKDAGETIRGIKEILDLGLAERVGISVYSLNSILKAKELCPELNVFQVPENICDRRMLDSKDMNSLVGEGVRFIIRSIFLQGLLLLPTSQIPNELGMVKKAISELISVSSSVNANPLDICLAYARQIPWVHGIIVGVAEVSQLKEIVHSKIQMPSDSLLKINTLPDEILDPRRWKKFNL